jgi:transcriptional regulator with XRE-family HTH domain
MRENTLKELIEQSNLTPTQVASKLGITRKVVYAWYKPDADIKVSNYLKLARVLGVSLKTLSKSMGHDLTDIPDDCIGGEEDK